MRSAGRVVTRHGIFDTPAFMPVGTQGTIKGVLPDLMAATGAQIILANTYHLMLRPGEKVVAELGGLHRFMGWPGPILTDSGGFQVFSLADINQITDEGVTFKSHVDGCMVHLTPRRQHRGAERTWGRTSSWRLTSARPPMRRRSAAGGGGANDALGGSARAAHARPDEQSLFGIVQGGADLALRGDCARQLMEMDFPGYAVGGLAVGEGFEAMKLGAGGGGADAAGRIGPGI